MSLGAYFRNFTVIYNFIKGHNISLPGCTPLLLSIILLSVMNSSVIDAKWRKYKIQIQTTNNKTGLLLLLKSAKIKSAFCKKAEKQMVLELNGFTLNGLNPRVA